MKSYFQHRSLIKQFSFICLVFFLLFCASSVWTIARAKIIYEKRIDTTLKTQQKKIENSLMEAFNSTSYLLHQTLLEIKSNSHDLNHVNRSLSFLRTNPHVENLFSWTIFSWSDESYKITVDGLYGIMKEPYDLSSRDYISKTRTDPMVLHLGKLVFGSTSKRWMIPAGMGIANDKGEYLGAITLGFDVRGLTRFLSQSLKAEGIKFSLYDLQYNLVLSSGENTEGRTIKAEDKILQKLENAGSLAVTKIDIFGDESPNLTVKIDGLPYILLLNHDADLAREILLNDIFSNLIELSILFFFFCCLLLFTCSIRSASDFDQDHSIMKI